MDWMTDISVSHAAIVCHSLESVSSDLKNAENRCHS